MPVTAMATTATGSAGANLDTDLRALADLQTARDVLRHGGEGAGEPGCLPGCSICCGLRPAGAGQGRVVVTGMGKSGHVAVKIAATLASTGTPAQFVHPAEAAHGDLGMITAADAVLALSNSGETPELQAILVHARRFWHSTGGHRRPSPQHARRKCGRCLSFRRSRKPVRWASHPRLPPPRCWRWATRWPWCCSTGAGSLRPRLPTFIPAASSVARLVRVHQLMHEAPNLPLVAMGTRIGRRRSGMTRKRLGCVGVVAQPEQLWWAS